MYERNASPRNLDEIVIFYKKYKEFFVEAMVQPQDFKKNVTKNNPAFAGVNRAFALMINNSIDNIITQQKFTAQFGEAIIYKKQNAYQHAIIGKLSRQGIINDDYEYLRDFYRKQEYAQFLIENAPIINQAAEQWYAAYQEDTVKLNQSLLTILLNVDSDFDAANDELNELPDLIKTQLDGKYTEIIEADYTRFLIDAIHDMELALKKIQLTISFTAFKEFAEDIIVAGFCRRLYLDVKEKKNKAKRVARAMNEDQTSQFQAAAALSPSPFPGCSQNASAIQSIETLINSHHQHQAQEKKKIDIFKLKGFTIYSSETTFDSFAEEKPSSRDNENKRTKYF